MHLPREHGAWAMLYVSFAFGALTAGTFNVPLLLALAAVTALFFARESLRRQRRARRRGMPPEPGLRRDLVVLGFLALASGLPLLLLHRRLALAGLGALALVLLASNLEQTDRHEERSIGGELLAVLGFSAAAPTAWYAALGTWGPRAWWLWAVCALYFASSIFHLKCMILALQPRKRLQLIRLRVVSVIYHVIVVGVVAFWAHSSSGAGVLLGVAFVPLLLRTAWALVRPPRKLRLRRIGVFEVGLSLFFLTFGTAALR